MAQKKEISVFLDTGLQKKFVPLFDPNDTLPRNAPEDLEKAVDEVKDLWENYIPQEWAQDLQIELQSAFADKREVRVKDSTFVRARLGDKTWHLRNGNSYTLIGLWFLVETNTSREDANKSPAQGHDRGYFYRKDNLNDPEKEAVLARAAELKKDAGIVPYENTDEHPSPYIPYSIGAQKPIVVEMKESSTPGADPGDDGVVDWNPLLGGNVDFELVIKIPGGDVRDVDLILDLGNTRTAGLLFDHLPKMQINPAAFKQAFKILRIKPDPNSGEYDSVGDVEAGIVQSWFVLHELDHQKYYPLTQTNLKEPALLEYEYIAKVEQQKEDGIGGWFGRTKTVVTGDSRVIKRIPQMFTQLSPVLLGDRAERQFNLPYAKSLIEKGANLQQSSPKRYYWDDSPVSVYWNMLLNDWDPAWKIDPKVGLPNLQGEMLRFIKPNGDLVNLLEEVGPARQPTPFPCEPNYPKQTTLTWFVLKLLETAYAQSNTSFDKGAQFIPHRLHRVLLTYPSGWTSKEVSIYHQRCQQALDIFSHTNVYHGLASPMKLELVPSEKTPDEAVASQLPFVFSEIIRYPNQTTRTWLSRVGKKREGVDSVRIMNFDIGGGTTDISIVEYTDSIPANAGVQMNNLTTSLLFKDGQNIAGDNLVQRIIEKFIFPSFIAARPSWQVLLRAKFTQPFNNNADQAQRTRVIRTCLIPLATYCLANLGESGSLQYSAEDAHVAPNNWQDLQEFLGVAEDGADLPFNLQCINCDVQELNVLIEELFEGLFRNCAMYAAAFDIDLIIFSGKPSELPYIRSMAKKYIPVDDVRMIFAKGFKAGAWYPFTDDNGCISDAKTVTVVGAALYYALSAGLIAGWSIQAKPRFAETNEWGQLNVMKQPDKTVFLSREMESVTVPLLPNTIIGRRQNRASSPEPVYKFICHQDDFNRPVQVTLKRVQTGENEELVIESIDSEEISMDRFELKLWPSEDPTGLNFWQEQGIFNTP